MILISIKNSFSPKLKARSRAFILTVAALVVIANTIIFWRGSLEFNSLTQLFRTLLYKSNKLGVSALLLRGFHLPYYNFLIIFKKENLKYCSNLHWCYRAFWIHYQY